jgi:hypothetical protein
MHDFNDSELIDVNRQVRVDECVTYTSSTVWLDAMNGHKHTHIYQN